MKVSRGENGKRGRGENGKRGRPASSVIWYEFLQGASTRRLRSKHSLKQSEVEEMIRAHLI